MDTILLFKKDLNRYPTDSLQTLHRHFNLPPAKKEDLAWLIAIHQARNNNRGLMPTGEERMRLLEWAEEHNVETRGEVMQAMSQGRISRQEGLELMKSLPITLATKEEREEECSPPAEHKDCTNEKDYLSQGCWSQAFEPEIKIRFVDPTDYSRKPNIFCMRLVDFRKIVSNIKNEFHAWYPNEERQWKNEPMDSEGYGGSPSSVEKYVRVFTSMYLANKAEDLQQLPAGTYTAYPVYTNKRIGNRKGRFGVGKVHGQEPGYTIHYITTGNTTQQLEQINDYIKKIRRLKELSTHIEPHDSIKELIEEYTDKDTIPSADRVISDERPSVFLQELFHELGRTIGIF